VLFLTSPQKALCGGIPDPYLEPLTRSWSHFVGIYCQNLTDSLKLTFEIPPRRALRRMLSQVSDPRPAERSILGIQPVWDDRSVKSHPFILHGVVSSHPTRGCIRSSYTGLYPQNHPAPRRVRAPPPPILVLGPIYMKRKLNSNFLAMKFATHHDLH